MLSIPFIDVHNHQFRMPDMDLGTLIEEMDKLNMQVMVNLSGRGFGDPEHLAKGLNNVKDRTIPKDSSYLPIFVLKGIDQEDWPELTAKQIELDVAERVQMG